MPGTKPSKRPRRKRWVEPGPPIYRDTRADDLLRAYHRLKSRLMQVPGMNPRGTEGTLYDSHCPHCGGSKWTKTWSHRKGHRTICAAPKCGEVWPTREGWLQPGLIQASRRSSTAEGLLPKLATLERLLFARPRDATIAYWEMCCWCWALHVWENRTAVDIAALGRITWERSPRPFTWFAVRDCWQYARSIVSKRIERAGVTLPLDMEEG